MKWEPNGEESVMEEEKVSLPMRQFMSFTLSDIQNLFRYGGGKGKVADEKFSERYLEIIF